MYLIIIIIITIIIIIIIIIVGFVSLVRGIEAKNRHQLKFHLFFHSLSTIMYFQNIGIFTIATT